MAIRRIVLVWVTLLLLFASEADAKGAVQARLSSPIPFDAAPGTTLRIAWTLLDADGVPLNASGVFVRLRGPIDATTAFASTGPHLTGAYEAVARVPEGGIQEVEIGLRGSRSGASGNETSDILFPIVDTPPPSRRSEPDDPLAALLLLASPLLLGLLAGVAAVGAAALRRRWLLPRH